MRAAATAALLDLFSDNATDIRRHPALVDLAAHARHLTTEPAPIDKDAAALLGWLAHYDFEAGRPTAAADQYERTLEAFERILGPDHPSTLSSRNNLAAAYSDAGRLTEAVALYEQRVADTERLRGHEDPQLAVALYR